MKRAISFVLAMLCVIGLISSSAIAKTSVEQDMAEQSCVIVDGRPLQVRVVKTFDDGSQLLEGMPRIIQKTRGNITAQKPVYHRRSDGIVLWSATLVGTFTYNGVTSFCSIASCSTSINDSAWSEQSCSAYPSGNSAIGNVTMIRKILFIVLETVPITITLTCDKNGNLS